MWPDSLIYAKYLGLSFTLILMSINFGNGYLGFMFSFWYAHVSLIFTEVMPRDFDHVLAVIISFFLH